MLWQANFKIPENEQLPDVDYDTIVATIRYWDKAGTEDGGARTAGVKMHYMASGRYIIEDCEVGQWGYAKREAMIKTCAELDGASCLAFVEQEPGSGGKESAERTIDDTLDGYAAFTDKVTGSKIIRAEHYAVQVEKGNIYLIKGEWNKKFLDEHKRFLTSKFKDHVDASTGAFNNLADYRSKGIRVI